MKVYVAHLKSGGCPKGSSDVKKGKVHRCKIRGRSQMSGKRRK